MKTSARSKPVNIDDYHLAFKPEIRTYLDEIRNLIRQSAPEATETISYGMPAFKLNKVLVYYAAYQNHIGFYPTPDAIEFFQKELTKYKTSKGAIQFPLGKSLPSSLIKKIVKFRVKQESEKIIPVKKTDTIFAYHKTLSPAYKEIAQRLEQLINEHLPEAESKIWHAHPVWFIEGNPIAGYHKLKDCMRLLFWSGQSFDEPELLKEGSFKAAEKRYTSAEQIDAKTLKRWLRKARDIQWDYKNLIKRKGRLERLK